MSSCRRRSTRRSRSSWYLHNPAQVVRLSLAKTAWFWSNWYGPVAKGTMARNPWLRIDPIKAMVTTQASYDLVFGLFGQIVSWARILGGIAVLLLGVVGTWRVGGLERTLGIALSIIVIASWVISLGTIGDHRFRVPIMTASLFLQVVGWRFLWGRGSLPGIEARPRRLARDARGEPVPAGSGMSAPKSPRAGARLRAPAASVADAQHAIQLQPVKSTRAPDGRLGAHAAIARFRDAASFGVVA